MRVPTRQSYLEIVEDEQIRLGEMVFAAGDFDQASRGASDFVCSTPVMGSVSTVAASWKEGRTCYDSRFGLVLHTSGHHASTLKSANLAWTVWVQIADICSSSDYPIQSERQSLHELQSFFSLMASSAELRPCFSDPQLAGHSAHRAPSTRS